MTELPYLDESTPSVPPIPFSASLNINDFEVRAQKGSANGYAPLDANAKVPVANLPDQASVAAAISAHNALTDAHGISNTANLVYTNDARLSDSRAPTLHSHAIADVTNLQPTLDGKQASGSYELTSNKNAANGYAGLDAGGKISLSQLPDANATEAEAIGFVIALG